MTSGGVEHRAVKVSFAMGLSTALSIVFQLVSVPVCLAFWGKEKYGIWLVVFAAFTLLRTVDAGYITYVGNRLNLLYHRDVEALRKVLASSIAGIVLLGAIQLLLTLSVIVAGWLPGLLGVSAAEAEAHRAAGAMVALVVTWVLSGSYLGIVHRLLIPAGMMYQASWWGMAFQVSQFAAIMLAATLRLDLFRTGLLFAFVQAVIYLGSAVWIRRRLPDFFPWWRGFESAIGIRDLRRSIPLTLSSIIQQGTVNGIVILVSASLGPAAVPVFTTLRILANLWTNVTNVLSTPLLPDVVRYHGNREGDKVLAATEAHWWLLGTVVNLGILVSYPLIGRLYAWWTSREVVLDEALLCLLLGGVALASVGALMTVYLSAVNNLKAVLATTVARAVSSLLLGGILLAHFGLAGIGLGILVGELLALILMGRVFFVSELAKFGVSIPLASVAPAFVGTVSVLAFLVAEGTGASAASMLYPAAITGVVLGSVWGWSRLEPEIRGRLTGTIRAFRIL